MPCEVILSSLMPPGTRPQTKQALLLGLLGWVLLPGPSLPTLHPFQAVVPKISLKPSLRLQILSSMGKVS